MTMVAAWIRFPGIAMHLYHKKVLRAMGNRFGKLIQIDYNTSNLDRGKFARIAVEQDLSHPVIPLFFFRGKSLKVVYEGLPTICFPCGLAGYSMENCPSKLGKEDKPQEPPTPSS